MRSLAGRPSGMRLYMHYYERDFRPIFVVDFLLLSELADFDDPLLARISVSSMSLGLNGRCSSLQRDSTNCSSERPAL